MAIWLAVGTLNVIFACPGCHHIAIWLAVDTHGVTRNGKFRNCLERARTEEAKGGTKQEAAVLRFHGTLVLGWLAFTVISNKLLNCKFHSWSQIQELFSWFLRIQGKVSEVFARPLIYSQRTRSRIIFRRVVSLSERFVLNRTLIRILLILQV